jgi:hypothetical protein
LGTGLRTGTGQNPGRTGNTLIIITTLFSLQPELWLKLRWRLHVDSQLDRKACIWFPSSSNSAATMFWPTINSRPAINKPTFGSPKTAWGEENEWYVVCHICMCSSFPTKCRLFLRCH